MSTTDTSAPKLGGIYLLLALVVFLLGSIAFHLLTPMPHYEYTIKEITDANFDQEMNDQGKLGWEAISARRASDGDDTAPTFGYEIIFKRIKN